MPDIHPTPDAGMIMPAGTFDPTAPHADLSGTAAAAESAGKAWNAGAAEWAESPQGAGLGGWTLNDEGATGEWPSDMSFPHQGP